MHCATLLLAGMAALTGEGAALPSLSPGALRAPALPPAASRRAVELAAEAALYVPDYAVLATLAGLSVGLYAFPPPPNPHALFGPSHDPATGDTSSVYAPRWDGAVGKPYRHDTVHSLLPTLAGNAAILAAAGTGFVRKRGLRKLHHALLGAVQAQAASFVATEVLKSGAGRLRPDYRERMRRYYCAPGRTAPRGVDCAGYSGEPLSRREFDDGRRSFPSGHTVQAFSTATYLALLVGGELVWSPGADAVTRAVGVSAQACALAAATLVGVSRYADNRHHVEDVVAGGVLGAGSALASYAVYFGLEGQPRARRAWLNPVLTGDGAVLALGGVLP